MHSLVSFTKTPSRIEISRPAVAAVRESRVTMTSVWVSALSPPGYG